MNFLEFWEKYKGAIIGGIIAIVLILTKLYKALAVLIAVGACAYLGNYVQQNKYDVKEKLKNFIDKLF